MQGRPAKVAPMKVEFFSDVSEDAPPASSRCISVITAALLFALTAIGCDVKQRPAVQTTDVGAESVELVDLTLVGYNYTEREIARFSVNGTGGGNLHVSGPYGGGGGSVCCVKYFAGDKASAYKIRWHASSCRYGESGKGERYVYDLHRFYKERTVAVEKLSIDKAKYIEVHFFPDGSIKARLTAEMSPPILSLPVEREADGSPQCPNNKKPLEFDAK
jgi:hypothetical protein